MRVAILDLGTNTFNLLIVDVAQDKTITKVFNEKLHAKLGAGGINKRIITDEAFERGLDCLRQQKQIIDSHGVDMVYAFATSAIRNAQNGMDFVAQVKSDIGIEIQVISGDKEAEYIYFGNRRAVDFGSSPVLILDIGGGSNEFIIATQTEILWKQSFELGMQRMLQRFTPPAPIPASLIVEIEQYIVEQLAPLYDALKRYPVKTLIGSSGSFDTFRDILVARNKESVPRSQSTYDISIEAFKAVYNELVGLTIDQMREVPGMDIMRIEMIGVAGVFIDTVLKSVGIENIKQSSYALKEGVIFSLTESEK